MRSSSTALIDRLLEAGGSAPAKPKFDLEDDGSLVVRGAVVLSPNPEFTREDIAELVEAWRTCHERARRRGAR